MICRADWCPTSCGRPQHRCCRSTASADTEANGLPLAVAVSGANAHDINALRPLVHAIPPVRSRRGPWRRRPARLHADKGYDYDNLRHWVRNRNTVPRIGVESSSRLGRYRRRVERSFS